MKEAVQETGGFLPADADATEDLQSADRPLDCPAPSIASQRSPTLPDRAPGAIESDHLDVLFGDGGVERVAVVGFVADDAIGTVRPMAAESRVSNGFAPAGSGGRGCNCFAVQAGEDPITGCHAALQPAEDVGQLP